MRQLHDSGLLAHYIERYDLQNIFSFDLTKVATLVSYEPHELISQMGELYGNFLILVEGECMAYVVTGAEKLHCERHYRGLDIMGLVSVLWNQPTINTIRAITPCVCVSIPGTLYREDLMNDVKFLRYTAQYLAAHIRKSATHFEPLENRLASFILEMAQKEVFQYNLTLCAELLETSYRHLLRTLHNFCESGILKKQKKGRYLILDKEKLEALGGKVCLSANLFE